MRKVLMAVVVVALVVGADKQEQRGVITLTVSAEELAKQFKEDAAAARRRYDPNGPKGGAGGTILTVHGVVERVSGNDVYLRNEAGLQVLLHAKKLTGDRTKAAEGTGGKFKSFRGRTILIECSEVKFLPFAGGKK